MPIIEKVATEAELRDQILRLDAVMTRNPTMTKDLSHRKQAVQRELNLLLLSQPGYVVVNREAIEAHCQAAREAGYATGYAQAGEDLTK